MEYLALFDIPFIGLNIGNHNFQYKIDKRFFDNFEFSPISDGRFEVELSLEKKATMMLLEFKIEGEVGVTCDRCLKELSLPLDDKQEFIIKFGEETTEAVDNIMTLAQTEYKINVAQNIYEYINLMLPARTVCEDVDPNNGCDAEVISRLDKLSHPQDQSEMDPRWAELKKLKTK